MNFAGWFMDTSISEAEIRAEVWKLGVRYLGWPMQGALDELKAPNLPARRVMLLRACVRQLEQAQRA